MSLPFKVFSCSRCEFTGLDLVISGHFNYEAPSGLFFISRRLGWCNECNGIVAVENIPNVQKIVELKSEIEKKEQYIAHSLDRLEKSRSWFKKLLNLSVDPPSEIRSLILQCEYDRIDMKSEENILSLLVNRKSPPRCLECGSIDCFLLPELPSLPEPQYPLFSSQTPQSPVEIGLKHPGCGGELLVKFSEAWISIEPKRRIYDVEGRLIRQITTHTSYHIK